MRKKKPVVDFKKAINMEYPPEYYAALVVGVFFLVISTGKLLHPQTFAAAVFRGHLVPHLLVNLTALALMGIEFAAAFAVVFMAKWRRAGLWILTAIVVLYTGCVTVNLLRGLHTVCGCFGGDARTAPVSGWTLARNLAILSTGLFALRRR